MKKLMAFIKDEDGLELSEYAIMGALIIVVAAGTIILLGAKIDDIFNQILTALGGPVT